MREKAWSSGEVENSKECGRGGDASRLCGGLKSIHGVQGRGQQGWEELGGKTK